MFVYRFVTFCTNKLLLLSDLYKSFLSKKKTVIITKILEYNQGHIGINLSEQTINMLCEKKTFRYGIAIGCKHKHVENLVNVLSLECGIFSLVFKKYFNLKEHIRN